jgi:RNA polymerase sigma-70 factor (ECF subfamily)
MTRPPPESTAQDLLRPLVVRVRAGDPSALAELAAATWAELRQWALWEVGDLDLAEDACQDAWVRLVRSARRIDPDRNVRGWLRAIVRNVSRTLLAQGRRRGRRVPVDAEAVSSLDHELDLKRGAARMLAAFAELTPRQREAMDLVDRLGLTPAEAAERMGAAPGTVRALLHQGRLELRRHLSADELRDLVREP